MRRSAFVSAISCLVVACSSDGSTPPINEPGPPAALQIVGGDQQTATVGTELADALTVLLTDEDGRGIEGWAIAFVVTSGGGSLFLPTTTTGSDGRAANRWTLGTSTSTPQRVEARLVDPGTGRGFVAPFSATASAGEVAVLTKVAGDDQLGRPATALADSIAVAVVDMYDNPVPGATVSWTVSGGGAASPLTSTSNAQGVARTRWTLGPLEDVPQLLSASLGSLPTLTFGAGFLEASVDFGAGRWETLAGLPYAVRAPAVATDGERIYVVGGTDGMQRRRPYTQIYDPTTDSWSLGSNMPASVDFSFAAMGPDSALHVFGGSVDEGRSAAHFVYDPDTDLWSVAPAMVIGVAGASGEAWKDEIIVVGGVTGSRDRHAEVQVFEPSSASWSLGPPYPEAHLNAASEIINGSIYVAGGNVDGLNTSARVFALDPRTGAWTSSPSMPVTREATGAGKTVGNLCVFGGRIAQDGGFNTPFDDAYCYDFTTEAWRPVAEMPAARAEVGSVTLDGWIYAVGGHDTSFQARGDVFRFTGRSVAPTERFHP